MRVSRVFVKKPNIEPNIPKMVVGFFVVCLLSLGVLELQAMNAKP
jgi:hypothetical protein